MIVEFTGAPGVGKTTLMFAVRDELARRNTSVEVWDWEDMDARGRPLLARRLNGLRALASSPLLTMWCALNALPTGQTSRFGVHRTLWICRAARLGRRLRREPGLHLLDEGPLKVWPSLVARGVRWPKAGLRLMPMPDLCVILQAAPQVQIARIRARGNHRTPNEEIERWNEEYEGVVVRIPGSVVCSTWDTTNDEDHRAAVADWIESQIHIGPFQEP